MKMPAIPSGKSFVLKPGEFVNAKDWGRRSATLLGAIAVGLFAIFFARGADWIYGVFVKLSTANPVVVHLIVTPLVFLVIGWLTVRYAPQSTGSGIPQVIAASHAPHSPNSHRLVSIKVAIAKAALTFGGLFGGASVGREGPTVQLAAAIMLRVHKLFKVRITLGIYIAGGAAGVAAAFNTPLAGIAFAIEELAVAYEQRVAVLVMGAVMIAGITSQGIAGSYLYFGEINGTLPVTTILLVCPLAGILGGAFGGLFSRGLLLLRGPKGRYSKLLGRRPMVTALVCGVIVGVLGYLTAGATSGTGYDPTKHLLEGGSTDYWFGPAKFVTTLATSASAIPGGIFAPSLAVGAGFGELLTPLFPAHQAGLIVLIGMGGYFTGVVRAPLTAVIILSEATGSSSAILPLFATALIGDWAGGLVCRDRLYHALSHTFEPPEDRPVDEVEDGKGEGDDTPPPTEITPK